LQRAADTQQWFLAQIVNPDRSVDALKEALGTTTLEVEIIESWDDYVGFMAARLSSN
jgi:acetolactate synthase regulatory subunit